MHLNDAQTAALDEMARHQGASRAELVRQLIDRAIGESPVDTDADLTALEESFGALNKDLADDLTTERGPDARAAHLNRIRAS